MDILQEVPGVVFTADSITREKLATDMSIAYVDGHSSVTASISELGTLFTSSGMDMVVFLTDIYDCPTAWTHKTKGGGTTKIKAPFLNLLAGTTPSWLATAMPLDNIGIGFTSRVVFVYSDEPRVQEPIQKLAPKYKKLRQLLLDDLTTISTLYGEMKMAPDAYELYSEWYKSRINQSRDTDNRMMGYFERKPIHVIKTAMVLTLAESDSTVISVNAIERALGTLVDIEPGLKNAFGAVGKNPLSLDIEDVGQLIAKSEGGIPFAKILDMYKHSVDRVQLAEIMDILVTTGYAKVVQTPKGIIYFPPYTTDEWLKNYAGQPMDTESIERQIENRGVSGITIQELLSLNVGRFKYDEIKSTLDALISARAVRVIRGDTPTSHRVLWGGGEKAK
jgi:hypothetical protein